jgi:hypothetical protein
LAIASSELIAARRPVLADLTADLLDRFFNLVEAPDDGAQRGGYVGAIVGNGLMKRELGRNLK